MSAVGAIGLIIGMVLGVYVLFLMYRAIAGNGAPKPFNRMERLIDDIMRLPRPDRDALEYAVEKLIAQKNQPDPTLFELLDLFDKLPDDQRKAELAELRRRIRAHKGKP